ncbi:hypothetical protein GO013_04155 [Pseudodesulfovibrio sp. JC047]|uniref:YnbE family lipoprotein n=1 Tax=Pseudodesulfovibrio sp. JC047 TaxID=2683199 RepID=UPI0013D8D7A5|nr:YnbE family lipoprotein [Pseudodesulfovibrio sp. JC047]NDV18611.1 hypothetical protein [Pseudodesulfovibrio sp. JC047]
MKPKLMTLAICGLFVALWGCSTSHKVEVAPVEVKPIHITIDVNVKVDKELDDFFSDIDETPVATPEAPNAQ